MSANVENIDEYNDRMTRDAERHFRASTGAPRATSQELIVREETRAPTPLPPGVMHPLDVDSIKFKQSLELRSCNRGTLVRWLKDALVVGLDFGKIHFVAKAKCPKGVNCENPTHFTKDVLFKPGAEKICGMLGVTPTFPNLSRYEEAALTGIDIKSIILRCHILAVNGNVIAEGVGARALEQDYGDLNKSLKMASKSAHIDATLRMAGLSEIFSHPDSPPSKAGADETDHSTIPLGNFAGRYWADASLEYLNGILASAKAPSIMKQGARAELDRRPKSPSDIEFDDEIPF